MKKGVRKGLAVILAICFSMVSAMIPVYGENNVMGTALDNLHEPSPLEMETNRFIIKYKKDHQRKEKKMAVEKVKNKGKLVEIEGNQDLKLMLTDKKMKKKDLINLLKSDNKDTNIEYIQPDYLFTLESNDLYYPEQWGLGTVSDAVYGTVSGTVYANDATGLFEDRIHANVSAAWQATEGEGSIVAVIDTGVDIHHEDLKENIWVNEREIGGNGRDEDGNGYIDDVYGWNFSNNTHKVYEEGAQSQEAHGTHVAGIIAAVKDNEKGMAGAAPKAKVMVLKVFNNGTAYTSDIINGIHYAEAMGAKIVNCSWGSMEENPALEETIKQSKMLFIAAAGNHGINIDERPVYPASYNFDNVLTVGALDRKARLHATSNYGQASVDAAAPGEEVLSTIPADRYEKRTGTSMAAAFASGEAALIYSRYGDIGAKAVKDRIIESSDQLNSLSAKIQGGNLINAYNAVNGLIGQEITIAGYTGEETVTDAVYGTGFTTFSNAAYSMPQTTSAAIFSVPAGSVNGKMNIKLSGNINLTSPIRIKSIGENLFNPYSNPAAVNAAKKIVITDGIKVVTTNNWNWANTRFDFDLEPNTRYKIDFNVNTVKGKGSITILDKVSGTALSYSKGEFTTPNHGKICIQFFCTSADIEQGEVEYKNIILTKHLNLSYRPHQEYITYLPSAVELHSLSNGVKDEITSNCELARRTIKVILDGSLNWKFGKDYNGYKFVSIPLSELPDIYVTDDEDEQHIVMSDRGTRLNNKISFATYGSQFECYNVSNVLNSFDLTINDIDSGWGEAHIPSPEEIGTYFMNHPYTLIYQLAQPEIIKLNMSPIIGYENGTLYIDRAVKDMSIYKGAGIAIKNTAFPIQAIESVYKVTENAKIPVNLSQVWIASDKLSFTIEGAKTGDQYEYVYLYDASLGTLPTIEFSAPLNSQAQIEGNIDMIEKLLERIELLEEKVRLLEENGAGAGGSGVVRYEYDANGRLTLRKFE
ncbi:S8 family peptidase [Geosporobacter ferrireducens]|uniref:Peptidase S8/S53 domain-containing protein n=1 Tax=Geosporobacter ferrireducens TaxID=1424294 RepID=A0A1D8GBQ5_9FIRM|nr:S8 family peptidase [Geosporobacter ferrireducens]AOT68323.1 hypothetical protein Gferi_01185 [Geosporobacter ferrireducens]